MAGSWSQGEGCRRMDGEEGGGAAGGVPVVLVVCYGAATIKECLCTAFEAVRGGGEGYFCTVPTLHRRRRWIGSRGRGADGSQAVRLEGGGRDADGSQAEGMAAAAGRRYPPSLRYGWNDMSVWLAEIFF